MDLAYLRRYWPLMAALGVLTYYVVRILVTSTRAHDGHVIYTLDDPYIHMAIAKNFVQHGVWGITTAYHFSGASSSPLWTLLLALIYLIVGPNEITPLILNILAGAGLLGLVFVIFRKYAVPPLIMLIGLLVIIFLPPLPTLIFSGQEHTLHALMTVGFAYLAARALTRDDYRLTSREAFVLWGLAFTLPMIRYESLFLIGVVVLLFVIRRRWMAALLTGAMPLISVGIYGLISVTNNGFWFPTPVILKTPLSGSAAASDLADTVIDQFGLTALKGLYWFALGSNGLHVTVLILAALVLYVAHGRQNDERQMLLISFALAAFLHLRLAQTGWFYRYEAYLMVFGVFVIACAISRYVSQMFKEPPRALALGALLILMLYPGMQRADTALKQTPDAINDIYKQQYQMALFLKTYYRGEGVALNDVGAVGYLSETRLLDLWGLGNLEIARAMRAHWYNSSMMDRLVMRDDVRVIMVYDEAFYNYGGLPSEWFKVGEWTLDKRTSAAHTTVSIYAADPMDVMRLVMNLHDFAPRMPAGVSQTIFLDPGMISDDD